MSSEENKRRGEVVPIIKTLSLVTICHKSIDDIKTYISSFIFWHDIKINSLSYEFIFVENSGQPWIREVVQPLRLQGYSVKVIDSENEGFAKGCNLGAKHSSGELIAFVNPDVVFKSSLNDLDEFTEKASWGTIRQLTPSGNVHAVDALPEYKNILFEIIKGYRIVNLCPKLFLDRLYVVGSFLIVSKFLFERSGGFNEEFFLYYEEAEFCRRLQHLGGLPLIEKRAMVLHNCFGSQTNRSVTFKYEAQGFLTYCRTTQQPRLLIRRLMQLRVLGVFFKTAQLRYRALKEIV